MAPESFNASLPERDIILAKCVFCSKSEACQNAPTQVRRFFISTFFSLFFVYEFRVFCPHFQTLNSCVCPPSSYAPRSVLHTYSFVPSLSLESRWNPGDHLHWRRRRTVFLSIDLRSVFLLRFVIGKECAKNRTFTQSSFQIYKAAGRRADSSVI